MRGDCGQHLTDVQNAADRLLELADDQANSCDHDDCLVLDGILRDCGLQIRRVAVECEERVLSTRDQN